MHTRRRDDDDLARDGESVRVPLLLMDGHRPGFVTHAAVDAAAAEARREARLRDLSNAWRGPRTDASPEPTTRERAYDEMCSRLRGAWRRP